MSDFYSPYRDEYGEHVVMHNIHNPPPMIGFNDNKKLSANLTLGEIRKASFIREDEINLFTQIPLDKRVVRAFQLLRDSLEKPITVTSSFRSVRHELKRGRTGNSQHTYGKALDLAGGGLVELLTEAVQTQNKLFKALRSVGVSGFGIYPEKGFIHIDVREPNADGGFVFFNGEELESDADSTKKPNLKLSFVLGIIVGVFLIIGGIYKRLKDWRR